MKDLKNQSRSIGDKIKRLSNELGVGYANVMTEFLIERLVVRLVTKPNLKAQLVFKGGYVSLRVYHSPRYTVDLDVLLQKGNLEDIVKTAQTAAESDYGDGVWFRMEKTIDLETQGEYGGLRLVFRTGTGEVFSNLKKAQIINLDIGHGDPVVPSPDKVDTPFLLGGGALSWKVYPVETTVSEKLHALIVRGEASSRSKDIYDLNYLLPKCDSKTLKQSLQKTFSYRGEPIPENVVRYLQKFDRRLLKRGWTSVVAGLSGRNDFDATFDGMLKHLARVLK